MKDEVLELSTREVGSEGKTEPLTGLVDSFPSSENKAVEIMEINDPGCGECHRRNLVCFNTPRKIGSACHPCVKKRCACSLTRKRKAPEPQAGPHATECGKESIKTVKLMCTPVSQTTLSAFFGKRGPESVTPHDSQLVVKKQKNIIAISLPVERGAGNQHSNDLPADPDDILGETELKRAQTIGKDVPVDSESTLQDLHQATKDYFLLLNIHRAQLPQRTYRNLYVTAKSWNGQLDICVELYRCRGSEDGDSIAFLEDLKHCRTAYFGVLNQCKGELPSKTYRDLYVAATTWGAEQDVYFGL